MESAILVTLNPGSYTVILQGAGETTGIGLVEVYDIDGRRDSALANISTRAGVGTGNDIMIAGFIVGGDGTDAMIVRGIGPSLATLGLTGVLPDTLLELRDGNGAVLVSNDNWQDDAQAAVVIAAGLGLNNPLESAVVATVSPGMYTALLSGHEGSTGIGLVEIYSNPTNLNAKRLQRR